MQQRGHTNSDVFAHSGASFEDIVKGRACGGPDAVERYFIARRRMLVRDQSQVTARQGDPVHYTRVLAIIDRALDLLEGLNEPAEDGADQ